MQNNKEELYGEYLPHVTTFKIEDLIKEAVSKREAEIREKIENSKYVFERPKDDYLPEVYKHLKSKNEAKDDILSLLQPKDK